MRRRGSADLKGCGVIVVGVVALWVVSVVIRVLQTPWPWIALAAYLLFVAARRLRALHAAQRERWAVLSTISAQVDPDPARLRRCLAGLAPHAGTNDEAALLLVAHHLADGSHLAVGTALSALGARGARRIASPHRLTLRIPGIPVPVVLSELASAEEVAHVLRRHLAVRTGNAAEVAASPRVPNTSATAPLAAWTLVEAHRACQRLDLVEATARQALASGPSPAWTQVFREELARACEARERWHEAAAMWELLAAQGVWGAQAALERTRSRLAEVEVERAREAEADARRETERRERERREREALARASAAAREVEAAERATAKILAARTPAGRRSALQAGLAALTSAELRQQLLVAAARADVDAVLDRASTLKTAKAKRRHLEDALAALRQDAVPDDMQEHEIELLERSLTALEALP